MKFEFNAKAGARVASTFTLFPPPNDEATKAAIHRKLEERYGGTFDPNNYEILAMDQQGEALISWRRKKDGSTNEQHEGGAGRSLP